LLQCYVSLGDFLLARPHEASPCSVCIVIGIASADQLRVSWLWRDSELSLFVGKAAVPPLNSALYPNLQRCSINEVTERFVSVSSIRVDLVVEIAFVFHAEVLEYEFVNFAGMEHVFLLGINLMLKILLWISILTCFPH
jgi:hypothetical protein